MELSILLGAGASAGLGVLATKRMAEEFLIQHKDLELLHDTSFLNCNDIEEILKNVNGVKRLENHHLLTPYLNDIEQIKDISKKFEEIENKILSYIREKCLSLNLSDAKK